MALPNHNPDGANLSVYNMVLNRLWQLQDSDANKTWIDNFTLEVMNELEICFKIATQGGTVPKPGDITRIGDEQYYSVIERSITADLVTVYILYIVAYGGDLSQGKGHTITSNAMTTFLSKAKADTVEADFEQFDIKKGTTFLGAQGMIDQYKSAAIRKGRTLGCMIDIVDEKLAIDLMLNAVLPAPPFIIIRGGCGC